MLDGWMGVRKPLSDQVQSKYVPFGAPKEGKLGGDHDVFFSLLTSP